MADKHGQYFSLGQDQGLGNISCKEAKGKYFGLCRLILSVAGAPSAKKPSSKPKGVAVFQ